MVDSRILEDLWEDQMVEYSQYSGIVIIVDIVARR